MELSRLKRPYEAIFSLGSNCLPALQTSRLGLRNFSGPIDWMSSGSCMDVSRLLRTRFAGFMQRSNMVVEGVDNPQLNYLVRDTVNQIVSAHDFAIADNAPNNLVTYPQVMDKINRRIARFYTKSAESSSSLYIRQEASWLEAYELKETLASLAAPDFVLLIVNYTHQPFPVFPDWGIDKVCIAEFPWLPDIWSANNPYWDQLLSGVTLTSKEINTDDSI